jgi:transcriptional regulator with XRE-family HTH domain
MRRDILDQRRAAVSANIRAIRLRRELTQEQLAERADLAARYVQTLESPRANPRVDVLIKVAEALGVSPGQLFRPMQPVPRPAGRPRRASP